MFSRFIQAVACISTSFLLMIQSVVFFNSLPLEGWALVSFFFWGGGKCIFACWNWGESWLSEKTWKMRWNEMESAYPGIFCRLLMMSVVFTLEREEREAISDFPKWPSLVEWKLESFPLCISLQVFEESSHTFFYPHKASLTSRSFFHSWTYRTKELEGT